MSPRARDIKNLYAVIGRGLKAALDALDPPRVAEPVRRCFCGGTMRREEISLVDFMICDRCGRYE